MNVQDLKINYSNRTVKQDKQLLDISDSEFELLWVLTSNAGNIIDRDYIYQKVMGFEFDGLDRAIDMRISKLRKKLKDEEQPYKYIGTIRNKGYIFYSCRSE